MFRGEFIVTGQIRYGSRYFQYPIVASRAEAQLGYGVFHDLFAFGCEHAVFADMTRTHLRIGIDLFVVEPAELNAARGDHAHADRFRRFGSTRIGEFLVGNRRHVDLNVDAIHQRTGNLRHVALNLRRRAEAFPPEIVGKSAWTSLRCPFATGY